MPIDRFKKRKSDILSKADKSSKQSWDKKIIKLCNKINLKEDYYTTSSCSGRIILMIDQDKKEKGLFLRQYHDLITFKEFKKDIKEISGKSNEQIKFKQEPCILHIACKNLEDAKKIYEKAKLAGLKKSGIISSGKRFIVELNSTEKIEFPIIKNKKILVNDKFLKIIVEKSNENLKKTWKKINELEKAI